MADALGEKTSFPSALRLPRLSPFVHRFTNIYLASSPRSVSGIDGGEVECGWRGSLPFSTHPVCLWHQHFVRLGCNTGRVPALRDCASYVELVTHRECSVRAGSLLAVLSPKSWTLVWLDAAEDLKESRAGSPGGRHSGTKSLDRPRPGVCRGQGGPWPAAKGSFQLQVEA